MITLPDPFRAARTGYVHLIDTTRSTGAPYWALCGRQVAVRVADLVAEIHLDDQACCLECAHRFCERNRKAKDQPWCRIWNP